MKRVIAALILANCCSSMALTIRGSASCGAWITARQANGMIARANESWLVGYLSGLASGLGKDVMLGTDNESIFLYTDNHCRSKPLEHVFNAADALFLELVAKKRL